LRANTETVFACRYLGAGKQIMEALGLGGIDGRANGNIRTTVLDNDLGCRARSAGFIRSLASNQTGNDTRGNNRAAAAIGNNDLNCTSNQRLHIASRDLDFDTYSKPDAQNFQNVQELQLKRS
jgi:hypothetical protein